MNFDYKLLKEKREGFILTVKQAAEKSGVSIPLIRMWERGKIPEKWTNNFKTYCRFLGIVNYADNVDKIEGILAEEGRLSVLWGEVLKDGKNNGD